MTTKEKDNIVKAPTDETDAVVEEMVKTVKIKKKPLYGFLKRVFDIFSSLVGMAVLLVPLLILALVIVIDSPGASPIYTQERIGKNGRRFKFYKFRSMIPDAEKQLESLLHKNEMEGPAFKIKDDPRITRVGRFIRKTSIDEIPQLINVFLGDMSVVGPRPPLPREVEQYSEYHKQRLMVTPGLTCYWQIKPKRNKITFDDWVELDLKYIEERSFLTDIKIIFKTVCTVCRQEGE